MTTRKTDKHNNLVKQANQVVVSDPSLVLSTMVDYIDHFFGCRDCAENFLKFSENGEAVKREVKTAKDSVLFPAAKKYLSKQAVITIKP